MKLLIASHNAHKIEEIKELLSDLDVELLSLIDVNQLDEIEETGTSFTENALIKARACYEKTGFLSMADDSGIEIEALGNKPGVFSARYLGEDTPYTLKNTIVLDKLKDAEDRRARFISVIACVGKGIEICFEGRAEGYIAHEIRGASGFGYDPIFVPEGEDKSFGEMSLEEKQALSHRGKSLRLFRTYLEEMLG